MHDVIAHAKALLPRRWKMYVLKTFDVPTKEELKALVGEGKRVVLVTDVVSTGTLAESVADAAKTSVFDLALVDLNLTANPRGKKIEFNGIPLAARLAELMPSAAIVMYSSSILPNLENDFSHAHECSKIRHGFLLAAATIISSPAESLYEILSERVQKVINEIKHAKPIDNDKTLATRSAQDSFGLDTLEQLVRNATAGLDQVVYSVVQPGYSGAAILRVAGKIPTTAHPVRRILKISRSRDSLVDEIRRCPPVGSYYEVRSYLPSDAQVFSFDGTHCVSIPEVLDRVSLAAFLEQPRLAAAEKKVLTAVVDELLVKPAQYSNQYDSDKHTDDDYRLRDSALYSIISWLEEALRWNAVTSSNSSASCAAPPNGRHSAPSFGSIAAGSKVLWRT
jgi:hypothetical protein